MCRALAHLAVETAPAAPELVIDCWDCARSGLDFPMPRWPAKYWTARGEIMGLDSAEGRLAYFGWLKLLNAYFPATGRAFYCLAAADPFPLQQAGSPALTIFNWWWETLGFQLVHSAAVGNEKGGVLIAGHGGAGKSTLAFSTFGTPLRFLSDDYCLLQGPPVEAVALFASGKLTEQSLGLLDHLRSRAANVDAANREKALFYLQEQFPGEFLTQVPLRAVVLSHLSTEETSLEPIGAGEVYRIIAQSTLLQLAGTNHLSMIRLHRLLKNLPVFRLNHGPDRAATHRLLAELCES